MFGLLGLSYILLFIASVLNIKQSTCAALDKNNGIKRWVLNVVDSD